MNISRDSSKPRHQWQPQHQIHGKHLEISSSGTENPRFKKHKTCENFDPNQSRPSGSINVKAEPWVPQYQGFHDDSERFCRLFCNGRICSYGDRCRFLHAIPDRNEGISTISVAPTPSSALANQNGGSGELGFKGFSGSLSADCKPPMWKTKLCNNWKLTGNCTFGKVCRFAHGPAELLNFGGNSALESWVVPTSTRALKNANVDRNGTESYFKQQVQETKGSLKRKQAVKLCDIYADWLEDMIILPSPLLPVKKNAQVKVTSSS